MPNISGGAQVSSSGQISNGIILDEDVNANADIAASKILGDVETTGDQSVDGIKTFTSDPVVPDEAYGPGWNGLLEPPTKNAIYDKIETIESAGFPMQDIPILGGSTQTAAISFFTATDITGSVLFLAYVISTTVTIYRLERDSITKEFKITHTTTLTVSNGELFGLGVVGSYLYVYCAVAATGAVRRYDKADLANVTTMTISGTNNIRSNNHCWSDGTNMYQYHGTTNFQQWTISGTTITNTGTDVSFTSVLNPTGATSDGTYVWITNDLLAGTNTIRKYAVAGGAVISTTTYICDTRCYHQRTAGGYGYLFLVGSQTLGIAFMHNQVSDTAVIGILLRLKGIAAA